jgi:hypothetical protein
MEDLQMEKLQQPKYYHIILALCCAWQDKRVKTYDLLKQLAKFNLTYEQFNWIMQQSRNLTGKKRHVRL